MELVKEKWTSLGGRGGKQLKSWPQKKDKQIKFGEEPE